MLAKSTTRRALTCLAAALGFGLVLTAQGQAQPGGKGKGFDKKFGGMEKGFDRKPFDSRDERGGRDDRGPGPRTSLETDRLAAQIKALSAKLESLTAQLRELKARSGKGPMTARTGPEKGRKDGPMTAKGFGKGPMAKGDKGPPWMRAGGFDKGPPWMRGGFDRKGPPMFGRDMRGPDRRDYGRDYRRGPQTSARDGRDRGRPSMDRGPQRGPQARGPQMQRRPEPPTRGGSSLESRLDRLIGELEALKREVRNRR